MRTLWMCLLGLLIAACSAPQDVSNDQNEEVTEQTTETTSETTEQTAVDEGEETSDHPADGHPGQALVEARCAGCHGLDQVYTGVRTDEEWVEVINDMVGRGAQVNEEERATMVEYLLSRQSG